jgi:hypothetical protein
MQTMKIELRDVDLDKDQTPLEVVIRADSEGIAIYPKGYGDACSVKGGGTPIFLQLYQGKLMVNIWSDICKEDPTHEISLEGAKES